MYPNIRNQELELQRELATQEIQELTRQREEEQKEKKN